MRSIVNRIQRAFVIYGMVATFRLCVAIAFQSISRFVSSQWSARSVTENHDLEFDLKWGVDTGGTVVPEKSEVVGSNWIYGIKYQGCNSDGLDQALNEIDIQHERFTFVDFGSGKGRGILTASRFPFRKIIGVEYSEQLNEIARHNVLLFPNSAKKCKDIEVLCADAVRFPMPEGPLVIFLFCPFLRPVMTQVVQNVSTSFYQNQRRIVVLYFNPLFADVWKKAIFMKETRSSKSVAIYDTKRSRPPSITRPASHPGASDSNQEAQPFTRAQRPVPPPPARRRHTRGRWHSGHRTTSGAYQLWTSSTG